MRHRSAASRAVQAYRLLLEQQGQGGQGHAVAELVGDLVGRRLFLAPLDEVKAEVGRALRLFQSNPSRPVV